ncbi:hypothetical protein, partial [Phenylobacterium hankyongense]|uniref:hypothetical protein n=1 Tax=Phenylobacterium hankyongense TaxID=1813876 RepID=UPI001A9FA0EC
MATQIPAPSVRCERSIAIRRAVARNPLLLSQRGLPVSRRAGSVRYRSFSVRAVAGNETNAVSRLEHLLNLDVSPYTDKIIAEYIWIGGSG